MPKGLLAGQVKVGDALPELGYDVGATTVILGAIATRDWRPMHHDKDFAQKRNGVRDVFMNTPNQAAWFERFVTDWTGPTGRLGRMRFRMHDSVFPGDHMVMRGQVAGIVSDDTGCAWAELDLKLEVGGKAMTTCQVRVALPVDGHDNPWVRRGAQWKP